MQARARRTSRFSAVVLIAFLAFGATAGADGDDVAEATHEAATDRTFEQAYGAALAALERDDLDTAAREMEAALALAHADLGKNDPQLGILAFNLGRIELERGRTVQACGHLDRALASYTSTHGKKDAALLPVLGAVASCRAASGDVEGELSARERIVDVTEEVHGKDSVELGDALLPLAQAAGAHGKTRKASSSLKRALRIYKKQHGRESAQVGTVMVYMGMNDLGAGDFANGLERMEKGVGIMEEALPDGDPQKVQLYTVLLSVAEQMGGFPGGPPSEVFDAEVVRERLDRNRAAAAELAKRPTP